MFVLLHGSPGTRSAWSAILKRAPDDAEVFALDLPDHGSGPDLTSTDPLDLEQMLGQQLRELPNRPMTLVGLSYGAYLAARIAAAEPSDIAIEKLVLINGFAAVGRALARDLDALADAIDRDEIDVAALHRLYLEQWHAEQPPTKATLAYIDGLVRTATPTQVARQIRRLARLTSPELEVGTYRVPAVVVHSLRNPAVDISSGSELAGRGRETKWLRFDSACHLLPFSHPVEIAQLIFE